MSDPLEDRLRAVERAVTDGDCDLTDVETAAALTDRTAEIEEEIEDLEERVRELEAGLEAVRGYVGSIRAVNRDVENRADEALALARTVQRRVPDPAGDTDTADPENEDRSRTVAGGSDRSERADGIRQERSTYGSADDAEETPRSTSDGIDGPTDGRSTDRDLENRTNPVSGGDRSDGTDEGGRMARTDSDQYRWQGTPDRSGRSDPERGDRAAGGRSSDDDWEWPPGDGPDIERAQPWTAPDLPAGDADESPEEDGLLDRIRETL